MLLSLAFLLLSILTHWQVFFLVGTVVLILLCLYVWFCYKNRQVIRIAMGYTFAQDQLTPSTKVQRTTSSAPKRFTTSDWLILWAVLINILLFSSIIASLVYLIQDSFSKISTNAQWQSDFVFYLFVSAYCIIFSALPVAYAACVEQGVLWFELIGHRKWSTEARSYAHEPAIRLLLFSTPFFLGLAIAAVKYNLIVLFMAIILSWPTFISIPIAATYIFLFALIAARLIFVELPLLLGSHGKQVGSLIGGALITTLLSILLPSLINSLSATLQHLNR